MLRGIIRGHIVSTRKQESLVGSKFMEVQLLKNGNLTEEYIIAKIDSLADTIRQDMPMDRERWGDSYEDWEKDVEKLRQYVRDGARDKVVLADIQNYFGLTDAEMAAYFGD